MRKIKSKLPTRQEVFAVFSVAVFITFTWAIYRMFYQVPSWLFYLNLNNILTISAYVVGFAFLESAFLLGFLIILPIVYPERYFKKKFVAQSSIILLALTIGALLYQQNIGMLKKWGLVELILFMAAFLASVTSLIVIFSHLFDRFTRFKGIIDAMAERLTVFSLIYLPMGILGLVIMFARNIFLR
jgi:hypothetical protein